MFYKLLNVIQIEGDKIKLPIEKGEEIDLKKADKLAKKTKKLMENTSCKRIVLSKEIKKQDTLFGTRYLKKKMIILTIFMYFTSFYTKNKIITLHLTNITTKQYL